MPLWMKWAISFLVGGLLIFVGWKWLWVLVTLHVLICFLLIVVVLLQSGKAADLAGAFGGAGSQTAFGPRGAATFWTKATTWCAIMFMITSVSLVLRQTAEAPAVGGSVFERTQQPAKETPASEGTTPPSGTPVTPPASQPGASGTSPAPAGSQPAPAQQPPAQSSPAKSQPPAKQ